MKRTVKTNLKLFILLFGILLLFVNCEKEEKYTYDIISLFYNDLTFVSDVPMFPPPLKYSDEGKLRTKITKKDSLRIIKFFKERVKKKQIIAVIPTMETSVPRKINLKPECLEEYGGLLEGFFKMENIQNKIEISKIKNNRKDSIMYFKNEYLSMRSKEFDQFDILLSFSQIKFNNKLDKAIIIASRSTSKLSGFNSIYFLERKNGVWAIKCIKGLTIS
jgi:hypothetical protein